MPFIKIFDQVNKTCQHISLLLTFNCIKPSCQKKTSKVQKGMQNAQKWCDNNNKQVTKSYGKKG
jgi:hypothetical protein